MTLSEHKGALEVWESLLVFFFLFLLPKQRSCDYCNLMLGNNL